MGNFSMLHTHPQRRSWRTMTTDKTKYRIRRKSPAAVNWKNFIIQHKLNKNKGT